MKNLVSRFIKSESGTTAIEYGLIAALVSVVIITAITIQGLTQAEAARTYGVSPGWVSKLMARWRIDGDAARVARRLIRSGHEAYLVGGCVRDLLLGREPKDFDVATNADPDEIRRIFRKKKRYKCSLMCWTTSHTWHCLFLTKIRYAFTNKFYSLLKLIY